MNATTTSPKLLTELRTLIERGRTNADVMLPEQIDAQLATFSEKFGASVLRQLDGEALLTLMHGRVGITARCLAYWLEFKDDEEFRGNHFGGIGGGSALKYGVFQRKQDGAWVTGSPSAQEVISVDAAIEIARRQRDELLNGATALAAMNTADSSDRAYADLQDALQRAAPNLVDSAWAHKYWFLLYSDRLDDYHAPRYQRFHLFKLRQMPPDKGGIIDAGGPRYLCAGRFVSLARTLNVHVCTLATCLNLRDGAFHSYWKVGTTEGESGDSQWPLMRDGRYVSIGWPEAVPDLSSYLPEGAAAMKAWVKTHLLPSSSNESIATRKAGEIANFALGMAEDDIVLACAGQNVLGIGRITGPYEYQSGAAFPHKRPVRWLSTSVWKLPVSEAPRTTVSVLGKYAENLLEVEHQLAGERTVESQLPTSVATSISEGSPPLSPLDAFASRVENILHRKGQVILYGPPGTGKTYRALKVARELAARRAFGKSFDLLSDSDKAVVGPSGYVRLCTFHPGYGYEDFVEGLRPDISATGQMTFIPRDGIFKQLCRDAAASPDKHFLLIIDEINRGDLPRIFGELITSIEHDKRKVPIILPITQQSFVVPPNVFLVGTMNTADRSISLLDAAFRRRFGFVELMPDSSVLDGRKAGDLLLGPWLDALNVRLRKHLKRDARNLQIGHAYLSAQAINSEAEFARVLRDELIPLLEEYCYDDFETLAHILGPRLVDAERACIREDIFDSNRKADLMLAVTFPEIESLALSAISTEGTSESGAEGEDGDGEPS